MAYVSDYHRALVLITQAPLELTEEDFAVLERVNPVDERRARDAVKHKQLELVTKGIAPHHEPSPTVVLMKAIVQTIAEFGKRLDKLEGRR